LKLKNPQNGLNTLSKNKNDLPVSHYFLRAECNAELKNEE
jgi:hypothetical protein